MSLSRYLLFIGMHALALALGVLVCAKVLGLPQNWSFVQWDAHWYREIAVSGYFFDPTKHSSVAFFPLLPGIIALSLFSIPLVMLINSLVSVISIRHLSSLNDYEPKDLLLFLSFPLFLYFIVPYTEALFLLGSALLLSGIQRRKLWLVLAGTFIAILARYAATLLAPALILTAVYEYLQGKEKSKELLRLYGAGIASLLLGLFLVSWYQYEQTGVWTGYQQTHIHWDHDLRFPSLPFYSAMGSAMLLLDQVALLIAVLSAIAVVLSLWYRYRGESRLTFSPVQFLSLCYLAGSGASMVLFQGGSLDSLGRYVFATAFIYPLLPVLRTIPYKPVQLIYLFLGCSIFFLITGSMGSFAHFIANEAVAFLLALSYFLTRLNPDKSISWNYFLIWAGSLAIQSVFCLNYIRGNWLE